MPDISDKKYYSKQITKRFLIAMDKITGTREGVKVTASAFGEVVGISSSNLTRLRTSNGDHAVTVEAIGRLCHHYKISPVWLITGQEDEGDRTIEVRLQSLEKAIKRIDKDMSKRLKSR